MKLALSTNALIQSEYLLVGNVTQLDEKDVLDPKTYKEINIIEGYSKDKNHVYYLDHVIEEADPKTFQHQSAVYNRYGTSIYNFFKDKNYCYERGRRVLTYRCEGDNKDLKPKRAYPDGKGGTMYY